MYLVINKCVKAVKVSNFSGHYLHNRSTLDRGVLGYIGILYHKEDPPEVWHITPGTPCIYIYIYLRNRSTLDIGVLGYIGILYHKEDPHEVWHIPPGTLCIYMFGVPVGL
jgi:rubredoxin